MRTTRSAAPKPPRPRPLSSDAAPKRALERPPNTFAVRPGAKRLFELAPRPEVVHGRGARGLSVHPCVSTRPGTKVTRQLETLNALLRSDPAHRGFPLYDEKPIIKGQRSILSLGEGRSTFIARLLQKRAGAVGARPALPSILAYDVAYDAALAREYDVRFVRPRPKLSDHYVAGLFQDLDLRDPKGQRLQFDTIVSSWSLAYVVNNADVVQGRQILDRVIDHLKPGGALYLPGDWGLSERKMGPVLRELRETGRIRAYEPNGRALQR